MQDPQENQKFSVQEYAAAIRAQYPDAASLSDLTLVNTVIEQNPEVKDLIDFGEDTSKKKDATVSPSISKEGKYQYSPLNSREELITQFRQTTGLSEKDVPDGVIAYNAAKLYPELKDALGVRTEAYQIDWDAEAKKAKEKKRTVMGDPSLATGDRFKDYESGNIIIDEFDADSALQNPLGMTKIFNRAIASSEIGKITTRSFYGGSIDFDELAYYSDVLEKNAAENYLGSFGETAFGGFIGDVIKTLPESMISLIDSSLSPEAAAAAGTGAVAGSVVPVVGTATGAAAGAAFAGSGMLTFGTTLLQKLREAGVDVTNPQELEKAWNDREFIEPLAKEAALKAGVVGSFDAISAGLGGTISKSAIKAGSKRAAAEAKEYLVEGTLGGAGEAFGSLAAGDEVNMRDVALEMVADPAAGLSGRAIKTVLGKNADPDEVKILDEIEKDKDRTLNTIKVSGVENAEVIAANKKEIEKLEGALKNAPASQKKIIKKEIDRLQKENTSIHAQEIDNLADYTNEEIEEMAADADEIIQLVSAMESGQMTEENKEAVSKIVDNKAKALKDKRNKRNKGGISVSSTSRETGAPVTVTPEQIQAEGMAEAEAAEFLQPDAFQGFEEFMDSEEAPITPEDDAKEADDFEQLKAEMPDIQPEEAPILVQKRVDNKGREVKSYSQTVEEEGVQKTEYYSERDGERVPTGGVVFTGNEGFDKLLSAFNIPEEDFNNAVGEDVEAVAMTASETNGKNGKVELIVKKKDGTINVEIPFIETEAVAAPIEEAPVTEEVDDSVSEEDKKTLKSMLGPMEKALDALKSKDPNEYTEEEINQVLEELGARDADAAARAYDDAFEADMSLMTEEDMAVMDAYFSGEAKEVTLGLGYIKQVSEAFAGKDKKSSRGKKVDSAKARTSVEETKSKVNSSLTKYLKESLTDAQSFTQFIAENAMQGDFFTVGNALYRIGEVVEEKSEATAAADVKSFDLLAKTGKSNVKDAVDVLYRKVLDKTATKQEEALLDSFERGRFKEIKNKKVSIADIQSLLNVLNVTKKDGSAAVKQAFAMSKDKKTVKEFYDLKKKLLTGKNNYILKDENGNPITTEAGNLRVDYKKLYSEDLTTALKYKNLNERTTEIFQMRDFVNRLNEGKFAEVNAKKGAVPITKYMADRGIVTAAGDGTKRTVKFQRYSRKTGEPMPTAQAGKRKEVIRKRKTEFREYKEEQYTATVKDGKLLRKATNSERITAAFGKMGSASYTRFRDEVTTGKAEKQFGSKFRRSQETRAKISRKFEDGTREVRDPRTGKTAKVEKFKMIDAVAYRPKNKSNLVGHIEKVFGLHKDRAEAAAEISERLIKNMARRAGVKPSEIYDRITFVKNEYRGDARTAEDLTTARALGTILRRFGAPISESNLDENGNPINIDKLDQKATPITTDFKKYKQKGVEDSFTAQMIEDLKNLGVNVMSMKGDINSIISELNEDSTPDLPFETIPVRNAIASRVFKKRLLDDSKALNNKHLRDLVLNEIAAFYNIKSEDVDADVISKFELQTGRTVNQTIQEYATRTRGEQNAAAKKWLDWLESMGDAFDMGDITAEQYSKAFILTNTALNFNFSLDNNPENKLNPRSSSTTENLTPFIARIADEIVDGDGNNPIVDYTKSLSEKTEETSKSRIVKRNSDGTYWVKYKHTAGLNYEQAQEEVEALTFAAQRTSWCTKTAAQSQLEGGDFHILFDKNGMALTAIRQEGGRIAEERGNTSDQFLIPKYDDHLVEYKEKGFVEGYNPENDAIALRRKIEKAKEIFTEENLPLYLLDIAESDNPEKSLEAYKEKSPNYFDGYIVAKEGVNEVFDNERLIVPKNRSVTLKSGDPISGRVFISELVVSNKSITIESDDIKIGDISESPSSKEHSAKGYYPEIIVENKGFDSSKKYGDTARVSIDSGVAAVSFNEGVGAVEVIEGKLAWITDISFRDNIVRGGRRYRSFAEIPDRRVARRIITYTPEVFDKEGYFAGIAYDETWGEGARILNQEIESQLNKEEFIKQHLTGVVDGDLNRFKTKKAANEFIKKHKKNNPALTFNPIKKTMGVDAGMWFINIQRNPKHRIERKVDTEVRAQIALVDGQAVIFALTNPNVSSVVHEMSHMYEEYLTPQEVKVLEKWSGAKRNTVKFSETFARGFERFLADGKAPTPELKSIFSQFKEWMKNIYKAIIGSPIEKDITPEVREIFENMVMVEGDANFRETGFKTGDIVGPLKTKRTLNQEAAKSGMEKLEEVNSNSKKMVAAANETKDNSSTWAKFKKAWSDRQSTIRKYMKDRGLQRAEAAMNNRAGTGARAKYRIEPIAKKIYDGLSVAQEDILNMYLMAKRIIQIEDNREAKREYAQEKLNEFTAKKEILLETIKGKEYSKADQKVIEDSIKKLDEFIARAQKMVDSNRLYKVDKNGIETGELAFKHPNGMTKQDAEAAIQTMSKRADFDVIEKRGEFYFEAMSNNLKDLYEGGIIDKQTYERFKNDNYISRAFLGHIFNFELDAEGQIIETHFDNNADFYDSVGLGGEQIRALAEGSEGELIMNSRYLLEKAYQSASARVLKNKAAQALAKDMAGKQAPWYKQGNYKEREGEPVADRFGNYEVEPVRGFQTIYYRDGGKKRAFHLKDEVANEWNDIDLKIQRNFGMNTLRTLSGVKLLKAAATGSNPLFFLVNVPMDIAHVLFFTDVYDGNKLLPVNFIRVSRKVSKNVKGLLGLDIDKSDRININIDTKNTRRVQKLADIYFENGGGMDFMTQQGQELFDDKGNMITKSSTKRKVGEALGYTGNITELAMRLATVEQVIENLKSDRAKGKNSLTDKEINEIAVAKSRATMDFAQGGVTAKQVDMFVPYFNAAVQAFRVTREYLSTAKGRANFANKWAQASVGLAMITFYNLMMSESDDEEDTLYDDIPDYIKDNYFVILLPFQERNADGQVKYIRIRKTPNVAPFLNLSEAIARATYYSMKGIDDPRKGESTKSQFSRALKSVEATLPFVPTQAGLISKMPPTIQGAMKYIANYDPFRQMSLVPENEFNKISPSREGLGDDRVPLFLKAFGEATGKSPKRTQAVIESYVTSPTTNFLVGGAYSILDKATNLVTDYDKSKQSKYADGFLKSLLGGKGEIGVMAGRVLKETNPNWRKYTYDEAQKIKMEEGDVSHEIRLQTAFQAKQYRDAETAEEKKAVMDEFREFALTLRVPADRKRAMERFRERIGRDWSKVSNVDEGLSIKYAGDPEAAAKTFNLYFGVPNLNSDADLQKYQERLSWLRQNFGYKPSRRFTQEIMRLSIEKYGERKK